MDTAPRLRIGELSYRVGISAELLRTWERRYGVLHPARSEQGFRLYSEADEWRVRLMLQKVRGGLSAAEAAREVLQMEAANQLPDGSSETPLELMAQLGDAFEAFDEERAHGVLDRLLGLHGLERTIRDALIPYLHELGERWARGEVNVAQEHFASRLLEARLIALARGWNKGPGRRAVLACPSGEHHTLPLVCFGLVLRSRGWRNIYLGADSPVSTVAIAADTVDADLVVLSAVVSERFERIGRELKALSRKRSLRLAGGGATPELAADLGVPYLNDDPATAAEALARHFVTGENAPAARERA